MAKRFAYFVVGIAIITMIARGKINRQVITNSKDGIVKFVKAIKEFMMKTNK